MKHTIEQLRRMFGPQARTWATLVAMACWVSALDALAALFVFAFLASLTTGAGAGAGADILGMSFPQPATGASDGRILAFTSAICLLFGVRAGSYMAQTHAQHRLAHRLGVELSSRLLRGYLALPYAAHLKRNSTQQLRNMFDAVQRLVNEVLVSIFGGLSDAVMLLVMLVVLVVAAPLPTVLTALAFTPVVIVLVRTVHPRLKRLGRRSQDASGASILSLQHALAGFRDIRLLGGAGYFVDEHARHRGELARARHSRDTLLQLPRVLLETALVCLVALAVGVSMLRDGDLAELLPVLGLFGFAALRILPSLSRLVSRVNDLRFAAATVDDLSRDLALFEDRPGSPSPPAGAEIRFEERAVLEGVGYRYDAGPAWALRGADLEIRRGTRLGVVGPSGGGKSTLVDVLAGLLSPTEGRVRVDGVDIASDLAGWQRAIGVVSQDSFLLDDTLARNVAFGVPDGAVDGARLRDALRLARLEELVDALPDGLGTVVGERGVRISGGQRQRVAIARALYRQPRMLIFDEATAWLDNVTERELLANLLDELRGYTIVMTAHRLRTLESCDHIVVVDGGRIVDRGTYRELSERGVGVFAAGPAARRPHTTRGL